jgi:predicted solute-binding protein
LSEYEKIAETRRSASSGALIRTITLLRFISEPELREDITAATNKVEAYDGFSAWLWFGHDAIERNDPAEQESSTRCSPTA